MPAANVHLQVKGDGGGPTGLRAGAVGVGADEIDDRGQVHLPHQVGHEEESAGGDGDEDRRRGLGFEVGSDLGGELGHP